LESSIGFGTILTEKRKVTQRELSPLVRYCWTDMADLFLSYARPDRAGAEILAAGLEAAGYTVWWDRHITGGAEFSADIERQLQAAKVVVVAWSDAARQSPWVKDEAGVGREHGKLVALSFDTEPPPLGFRQYHAVDFSGWDQSSQSQEFKSLLQAIEARIKGEPSISAPDFPRPHRKPQRMRLLWVALLILIVAGLVFYSRQQGLEISRPGTVTAVPEPALEAGQAQNDVPRVSVDGIRTNEGDFALAGLASALNEGVANGLSRFSWLKVASQAPGAPDSSVAYRLEGSLRSSGQTLRLTMQLFKTATGEQVWGESYDRTFHDELPLDIQDELTANVVASVADSYGALMRDLSTPVSLMTPEEMTPYEAVLRHMIYRQRLGPVDHKLTLTALQRAVRNDPNNADAWCALAAMYTEEHKHDYNQEPGSLDRALQAVRRALELEPDNAYGTFILAEIYYFRQDLGAFRATAERAIALNPYDSDSMAMIGILASYGGEWEKGSELAKRAMALNPNHPGWYRFGIVFNQLRTGDYEAALETAQRINLPMYFADPYVRTLAYAYLGRMERARESAREFRVLWPYDDLKYFREIHLDRWFYAAPELISLTLEGLEMAGLEFD
jgi:TolB-like protein/Flp pilus assembly protein TadD